MVAPLLTLALTHCGGAASNGPSPDGGSSSAGESSSAFTAAGGSSGVGSGGQAGPSMQGSLIMPDADAGTPHCNELADSAPLVRASVVVDDPPTPQGGLIANGVYYLSKREDFVGLDARSSARPHTAQGSLVISGSTDVGAELQLRWMEVFGELPIPVSLNETVTIAGTSYIYTVTCGLPVASAASGSISFTATANELLWIYPDANGGTLVDTFQRE